MMSEQNPSRVVPIPRRVIVTGGAGFIGSVFVDHLNRAGVTDILIVDDLGTSSKWKNLVDLTFTDYLHKDEFLRRVQAGQGGGGQFAAPDAIVHLGACSATTEQNADYLMENNYRYTRTLAEWAIVQNIRFVYASSAATYGDGSRGFSDDPAQLRDLRPLNRYGYSKHVFDLYAQKMGLDRQIVGVKFFNVFGPREAHKGSMTSVVFNAFHEIRDTGRLRLFRSEHPDYKDGEQKRDFVYVKDCARVLLWFLTRPDVNGVFNLGTGQARTWNDLAHSVFSALNVPPAIDYIDLPVALKGGYQYFTQADMTRLTSAGYDAPFTTLEEAARDYIAYLKQC